MVFVHVYVYYRIQVNSKCVGKQLEQPRAVLGLNDRSFALGVVACLRGW